MDAVDLEVAEQSRERRAAHLPPGPRGRGVEVVDHEIDAAVVGVQEDAAEARDVAVRARERDLVRRVPTRRELGAAWYKNKTHQRHVSTTGAVRYAAIFRASAACGSTTTPRQPRQASKNQVFDASTGA